VNGPRKDDEFHGRRVTAWWGHGARNRDPQPSYAFALTLDQPARVPPQTTGWGSFPLETRSNSVGRGVRDGARG
jgi:hypothetical protein